MSKRKRYGAEEIIAKLPEAEVHLAQAQEFVESADSRLHGMDRADSQPDTIPQERRHSLDQGPRDRRRGPKVPRGSGRNGSKLTRRFVSRTLAGPPIGWSELGCRGARRAATAGQVNFNTG